MMGYDFDVGFYIDTCFKKDHLQITKTIEDLTFQIVNRYRSLYKYNLTQFSHDLQTIFLSIDFYARIVERILIEYVPCQKLGIIMKAVNNSYTSLFNCIEEEMASKKDLISNRMKENEESDEPGNLLCRRCGGFLSLINIEETKLQLGVGQFKDPFNIFNEGQSEYTLNRHKKQETQNMLYAQIWKNRKSIEEKILQIEVQMEKKQFGISYTINDFEKTQKLIEDELIKKKIQIQKSNKYSPSDMFNDNLKLLVKEIFLKIKKVQMLEKKQLLREKQVQTQSNSLEISPQEMQKVKKKNKQLTNILNEKNRENSQLKSKIRQRQQNFQAGQWEKDSMKQAIDSIMGQKISLQMEIDKKNGDIDGLRRKMATMNKTIISKDIQIQQLQMRLKKLKIPTKQKRNSVRKSEVIHKERESRSGKKAQYEINEQKQNKLNVGKKTISSSKSYHSKVKLSSFKVHELNPHSQEVQNDIEKEYQTQDLQLNLKKDYSEVEKNSQNKVYETIVIDEAKEDFQIENKSINQSTIKDIKKDSERKSSSSEEQEKQVTIVNRSSRRMTKKPSIFTKHFEEKKQLKKSILRTCQELNSTHHVNAKNTTQRKIKITQRSIKKEKSDQVKQEKSSNARSPKSQSSKSQSPKSQSPKSRSPKSQSPKQSQKKQFTNPRADTKTQKSIRMSGKRLDGTKFIEEKAKERLRKISHTQIGKVTEFNQKIIGRKSIGPIRRHKMSATIPLQNTLSDLNLSYIKDKEENIDKQKIQESNEAIDSKTENQIKEQVKKKSSNTWHIFYTEMIKQKGFNVPFNHFKRELETFISYLLQNKEGKNDNKSKALADKKNSESTLLNLGPKLRKENMTHEEEYRNKINNILLSKKNLKGNPSRQQLLQSIILHKAKSTHNFKPQTCSKKEIQGQEKQKPLYRTVQNSFIEIKKTSSKFGEVFIEKDVINLFFSREQAYQYQIQRRKQKLKILEPLQKYQIGYLNKILTLIAQLHLSEQKLYQSTKKLLLTPYSSIISNTQCIEIKKSQLPNHQLKEALQRIIRRHRQKCGGQAICQHLNKFQKMLINNL